MAYFSFVSLRLAATPSSESPSAAETRPSEEAPLIDLSPGASAPEPKQAPMKSREEFGEENMPGSPGAAIPTPFAGAPVGSPLRTSSDTEELKSPQKVYLMHYFRNAFQVLNAINYFFYNG